MDPDAATLHDAAARLRGEVTHLLDGLAAVTALAGTETWTGSRADAFVAGLVAAHRDLAIGELSVTEALLAAAARSERRAALADLTPPA